ncbi:MAG: hypothetical protein ABI230_07305 [Aestuariivirga sp.]
MQIYIDDKPVDGLSAKQQKYIKLGKEHIVATAKIISDDAAAARLEHVSLIFHIALGILVALLLSGIVIGVTVTEDNTLNKPLIIGFALAIAILIAFMFRYSIRRTRRNWQKATNTRTAGVPPAGSIVSINADGLTLNAQRITWPDIAIEAVGFRYIPDNEGPTTMSVERLVLTSPQASFALDTRMMDKGADVVNQIYRMRNLSVMS